MSKLKAHFYTTAILIAIVAVTLALAIFPVTAVLMLLHYFIILSTANSWVTNMLDNILRQSIIAMYAGLIVGFLGFMTFVGGLAWFAWTHRL